jgi:RNA recognition motif-containing protein
MSRVFGPLLPPFLELKTMSSSKEEPHMGSKIYVGGLPYSATEQQLSDLFGAHGAVASARIITDKFTGQSRGFGFVEMSSDSEAQAAITALNGSDMGGRTLTVNEARPQEPRGGGGGGRGGFGGGGGRGAGGKRDRW